VQKNVYRSLLIRWPLANCLKNVISTISRRAHIISHSCMHNCSGSLNDENEVTLITMLHKCNLNISKLWLFWLFFEAKY